MHDIDICLFVQELFIVDLINKLGLKLVNSINWGLNFLIVYTKSEVVAKEITFHKIPYEKTI